MFLTQIELNITIGEGRLKIVDLINKLIVNGVGRYTNLQSTVREKGSARGDSGWLESYTFITRGKATFK